MSEPITGYWYPRARVNTTCTLYVYFWRRPVKGVGSFAWCGMNTLTVIHPQGMDVGVPLSSLREAIVQYAMNNGISALLSPAAGVTPEAALRSALSTWIPQGTGITVELAVMMDGIEDVYVS